MENKVIYREIKKSDHKSLEKIISDTWEFDDFCTSKTAKRMARLYLMSCLVEQTFTCVAEKNGEAVGVIMGKDEKKHGIHLKYMYFLMIYAITMLITNEGRSVLKMFGGFEIVNEEMFEKCGKDFDGQISFFAVRSDQRGSGIGQSLFKKVLEYLESKSIQNYYLYTDDTCNFEFYESRGMKRIQENQCDLRPHYEEFMQLYLYASN